jgi:hypothetical protein
MPDAILKSGTPGPLSTGSPGVPALVDASSGALRTSLRPLDYAAPGLGRILGHYSLAQATGAVTGVASGGALFSFQCTESDTFVVLERLRVAAIITTAFTTAQALDVDAIIARNFSAPDTGGTTIVVGSGNWMRKLMGPSTINDMRIATVAALAAGTKTLDPSAFAIAPISQNNTLGSGGQATLYELTAAGQHPLIFGKNEGLNVRVVTAMGAVGVVKYYVTLEWAEVSGY